VRARFQHAVPAAGIANFGKKSLQVHRFRRGVGRRDNRRAACGRQSCEETRLRSGSLDDGVDERRRRGLAVRARHRHKVQRFTRMPKEIRRCRRPAPCAHARRESTPRGRHRHWRASSLAMATAPRDTASRIKVFPSAWLHAGAKNSARAAPCGDRMPPDGYQDPQLGGRAGSTPTSKALNLRLSRWRMRPGMEWPRYCSHASRCVIFLSLPCASIDTHPSVWTSRAP